MTKKVTKFDFGDGRGKVLAHKHINQNGDDGGWVEDNCTVSEDSYISFNSRVYNNSSVVNSIVYNNSSVVNSIVYNSSVDNSSVNNSSVYNNSSVDNSSVNNSSVYNSRVYNSSVYNSSVDNSSVNNSSVYNSSVDNNSRVYNSSVDNNSSVNNSSVNNSRVYNSRVYNSSVDNNSSVNNSSVYNAKISNTKQVYTQCPIGSRNDKCTAFIGDGDVEVRVVAGCFRGNMKKFEAAVLKTHGHSNYGKEYLAFIENAKTHFKIWGYLK